MNGTITRHGNMVRIEMPIEDVHSLRVSLQPCPCKAPKSHATASIRAWLNRGLARAMFGKPAKPPT